MEEETGLPADFTESVQGGKVTLDSSDFGWLRAPEQVSLAKITTRAGKEFYLGSCIRGNLKRIMEGLPGGVREELDKMFYTHVSQFFHHSHRPSRVQKPNSRHKIYYVRGAGKRRVYFSVVGQREGLPVVIRLGGGTREAHQKKIYSQLSRAKK